MSLGETDDNLKKMLTFRLVAHCKCTNANRIISRNDIINLNCKRQNKQNPKPFSLKGFGKN